MFTAVLFTEVRTRKQPKCPATDEWTKKTRCIHTVEYHSATKKDEIMPFVASWMNLETVILSDVRSREGEIWHGIPYMQNQKRNDMKGHIYF